MSETLELVKNKQTVNLFQKVKNLFTTDLSRHDLGVAAADVDASVETGAVVRLHDVPAVHLVATHATVVGTWSPFNEHGYNYASGKPSDPLRGHSYVHDSNLRQPRQIAATMHQMLLVTTVIA